jgi:hypothetical protein
MFFWSIATNWSPVGVPVDGDSVVFPAFVNVVVDVPTVRLNNMTVAGHVELVDAASGGIVQLEGGIFFTGAMPSLTVGQKFALLPGVHELNSAASFSGLHIPSGATTSIDKTGPGQLFIGPENAFNSVQVRGGGLVGSWTSTTGTIVSPGAFASAQDNEAMQLVGSDGSYDSLVFGSGAHNVARPIFLSGPSVAIGTDPSTPPTDIAISGPIAGTSRLVNRIQNGQLVELSGNNTFSGGLTLRSSGVRAASNFALGTGPVTLLYDVGAYASGTNYGIGTVQLAPGIAVANPIVTDKGRLVAEDDGVAPVATFSGTITIADTLDITAVASPGSSTLIPEIDLTGPISGAQAGGGSLRSSAPWAVLGGTTPNTIAFTMVDAGVMELAKSAGVNAVGRNLWVSGDGLVLLSDRDQIDDGAIVKIATTRQPDLEDIGLALHGFSETFNTMNLESGSLLLGDPGSGKTATLTTLDLTTSAASTLAFVVNGSSSDTISAERKLILNNTTLAMLVTADPPVGSTMRLIDNRGAGVVTGQFAGLPQGTVFTDGASSFRINYLGGDGNDVTVTRVPNGSPPTLGAMFSAVGPARVLDTRNGTGVARRKVGADQFVSLKITGRNGIPSAGVAAVAMNVTVTNPEAAGFVTVYPCGGTKPLASNLNYSAGQTIPNQVSVPVAADGTVCFYTQSATDLIADVSGWYGLDGKAFSAVAPARAMDTRNGTGVAKTKVGADRFVALKVTGSNGVPAAGVNAVTMNVTVTNPEAAGFITAYPCGGTKPLASNLNYTTGQTIPNQVTVPVAADGTVCFYSQSATDLIADVSGWFGAGGTTFNGVSPRRLLDTRDGTGAARAKVGADRFVSFKVTGSNGVPASGVSSVTLNVTVTNPEAVGFVTAYPCGGTKPLASNLNYTIGQTIPNQVTVPVAADGTICLYTQSTADLIADISGWYG